MEARTHAYSSGPVVRALGLAERLELATPEQIRALLADLRDGRILPIPARLAQQLGMPPHVLESLVTLATALPPAPAAGVGIGDTILSTNSPSPGPVGPPAPLPSPSPPISPNSPTEFIPLPDTANERTVVVGESFPPTAPRAAPAPPSAAVPLLEEVARASAVPANRFGRYILLTLLGAGGMGVVRRAWDPTLSRQIALKCLREDAIAASPVVVERFFREARAAARLRHPSIVAVHDVGEIQGRHYLTMDYIEGGTLSAEMEKTAEPKRHLQSDAFRGLKPEIARLQQVADAVGHAHALGIVHRDIKPSNVLVDLEGRPHVTDFGLAKDFRASEGVLPAISLTGDGSLLGTPAYMSPEQASGSKEVGPPSDVYSLGVILYETLTGRLPFLAPSVAAMLISIRSEDPTPPRRIHPRVPRDLETVCLKSLERDPARRYPDAAAFAADLQRWLEGEPVTARPVSLPRRTLRWLRRHPVLAGAGVFAAAILTVTVSVRMQEQRRYAEQMLLRESFREAASSALSAWRVGDAARQAEEHGRAERLAAEVLHAQPDLADIHLERGRMRLRADHFGDAKADLDRAVALVGDGDPTARATRGRLWIRRYRLGLEEARERLPDPLRAADAPPAELERAMPELGDLRAQAQADLEAASRLGLAGAERALVAAHLAALAGDWPAAHAAASRSLRLDASAEALWLHGAACIELARIAFGRDGASTGPASDAARREAQTLLRSALESLGGALALGRSLADAWLARAEARGMLVEDRRHEAIQQMFLGLRPYADVDPLVDELQSAMEDVRQAKAHGAWPTAVGRILGQLAWEMGEILRKTESERRRLEMPEADGNPFRIAAVRRRIGPLLTELESLEPKYRGVDVLYRTGQLWSCWANAPADGETDAREELRHAADLFTEVLERKPEWIAPRLRRGYTWFERASASPGLHRFRLGDFHRAVVDFTAVLERAPEEHYARLYRGDCRIAFGDWLRVRGADGRAQYRAALEDLDALDATAVPPVRFSRLLARIPLLMIEFAAGADITAHLEKARADFALLAPERPEERFPIYSGWVEAVTGRLETARGRDGSEWFRRSAQHCLLEKDGNVWWVAWAADALVRAGAPREALDLLALAPRYPEDARPFIADALAVEALEGLGRFLASAPVDPALARGALHLAALAARLSGRGFAERLRNLAFDALAAARRHGNLSWDDLTARPEFELLRQDPRWGR